MAKGKTPKKRMTEKEIETWNEVYDYFRYNILCYEEGQSLPKSTALRLKGMLEGKFMVNNSTESLANYSYEVLLNTLKYSRPDIQRGFNNNTFNDEKHRTNYALKIIEENLNTVYVKMESAKKTKEKMDSIDTSIITHKGAEYKTSNRKTSNRLNDLW